MQIFHFLGWEKPDVETVVMSDLHGKFPEIKKKFDLMFICGDVCPTRDTNLPYQVEWLKTEYASWVASLPFRDEGSKVVMVAGNHDFGLENMSPEDYSIMIKNACNRLVVLRSEAYTYEYVKKGKNVRSIKIFGTPYCKVFGKWAFMAPDDKLREEYSKCPDDADVIISHDSPTLCGLGMISEGWYEGTQAGNVCLDELIDRVSPKFFFSGHIHSGNHNLMAYKSKLNAGRVTKMANVSLLDEHYVMTNKPLLVNL